MFLLLEVTTSLPITLFTPLHPLIMLSILSLSTHLPVYYLVDPSLEESINQPQIYMRDSTQDMGQVQ